MAPSVSARVTGARVVTHVTDPLCPWAYSFEPVLRAVETRYGDQLAMRTVLIGPVSTVEESLRRGSSAEGRALTAQRFRRFGMPITPHVRERVLADTTGPVDRPAAETALTRFAARGGARRTALGDDALWTTT
jgi:protein-disulfide isomerase-like protein with CxxC motif